MNIKSIKHLIKKIKGKKQRKNKYARKEHV